MKIKQIKPFNIIYIEFNDQIDMCLTLCRMQEFYEGPKLRNKVVTLDKHIEIYARAHGGQYTYLQDWAGFNFPCTTYYKFFERYYLKNSIRDISKREASLYDKVDKFVINKKISGKFYIIACLEGEKETLQHEIRHGLFYLNKHYKKEIVQVLKKCKNLHKIYKILEEKGYHKSVFDDEVQAYLLTGPEDLYYKIPKWVLNLKKQLHKIESKYIQ